jgi:hypothetical protein
MIAFVKKHDHLRHSVAPIEPILVLGATTGAIFRGSSFTVKEPELESKSYYTITVCPSKYRPPSSIG